jgi:hypothetical protein
MVTNEMLERFPVSMMEQFRKLGMPAGTKTVLDKRVPMAEGETLSARVQVVGPHFEIKAATSRSFFVSRWADGE